MGSLSASAAISRAALVLEALGEPAELLVLKGQTCLVEDVELGEADGGYTLVAYLTLVTAEGQRVEVGVPVCEYDDGFGDSDSILSCGLEYRLDPEDAIRGIEMVLADPKCGDRLNKRDEEILREELEHVRGMLERVRREKEKE